MIRIVRVSVPGGLRADFTGRRVDNIKIYWMQTGVLGHFKMTSPSAILTTKLQLLVATSLLMFVCSRFSSYLCSPLLCSAFLLAAITLSGAISALKCCIVLTIFNLYVLVFQTFLFLISSHLLFYFNTG